MHWYVDDCMMVVVILILIVAVVVEQLRNSAEYCGHFQSSVFCGKCCEIFVSTGSVSNGSVSTGGVPL